MKDCHFFQIRIPQYLFLLVAVIPSLAVQHFFILFEVLRSLFADVDPGE